MIKARKRWLSILLTLAMLATLLLPLGGVANAGVASYNTVTTIPAFDPSASGANDQGTAIIQVKVDPALATSTAKVEVLASDGKQLTINGFVYYSSSENIGDVAVNDTPVTPNTNTPINAKSFELSFTPTATGKATLNFKLRVNAKDCAEGDVKVNFFATTGQLDAGSVVAAKAAKGQVTIALVGTPPTIGEAGDTVTIRLSQTASGALKVPEVSGAVYAGVLKFKLPAGFKWTVNWPQYSSSAVVYAEANDRVLLVCTQGVGSPTSPAPTVVDISAKVSVSDTATAKTGDVTATVETDQNVSFSPSELVVAKYAEYGATAKVASVKEILAGKTDQKTDTITIEEAVPGSLLQNRKITVTVPSWVKIVGWDSNTVTNITVLWETLPSSPKDCDNTATITINSTSTTKAKLEFKLKLLVEANKAGDVEATIGGAGMNDTKLVVAKAVAPVTASAQVADVRIGVRDQAVGDLTITENKAGAIEKGDLMVSLPDNVTFAATPSVEVTSGDLELEKGGVTTSDNTLTIKVKTESFKPSTLKVSGIKVTVDRTVPEGALMAEVKGSALVEYGDAFTTQYVTKVQLANCVTPAPGEQKVTTQLTIGSTTMKVNNQDVAMDAAPYIKDGRMMVSVRWVAQALRVPDENIIWDGVNRTVTVMTSNRVVQMRIGSKVMTVNGASITMNVAAEIVPPGRTCIPMRFLAQALGAKVTWDDTTKTATFEL